MPNCQLYSFLIHMNLYLFDLKHVLFLFLLLLSNVAMDII